MIFPLYIFLVIYFLFLFGWVIFSLVAIYHMVKFGFLNFATFFFSLAYIGISVLLLALSYNFISGIDWSVNVSMFSGLFNSNSLIPNL